jgi:hypothetical protein
LGELFNRQQAVTLAVKQTGRPAPETLLVSALNERFGIGRCRNALPSGTVPVEFSLASRKLAFRAKSPFGAA